MQNFKIEKSSLEGQRSKQHEEQKGKGKRPQYKLVYLHQLFPMLASPSQKEKDKVHEKYLKIYRNLL